MTPWCALCGNPTTIGKNGRKQLCATCAPAYVLQPREPMGVGERARLDCTIEAHERLELLREGL